MVEWTISQGHPMRQQANRLFTDDRGATTLEWALLLAGLGLPAYAIFDLALRTLAAHYQMMTTLNGLPLP